MKNVKINLLKTFLFCLLYTNVKAFVLTLCNYVPHPGSRVVRMDVVQGD